MLKELVGTTCADSKVSCDVAVVIRGRTGGENARELTTRAWALAADDGGQ